jgi:gliding motility-associated-like protein
MKESTELTCNVKVKSTFYLHRLVLLSALFLFSLSTFSQDQIVQKGSSLKSNYGFIENKGQIHDQNYLPNPAVKYLLSLGNGLNVQLKANSFSYDTYITERVKSDREKPPSKFTDSSEKYDITYRFHRVDIELVNANPAPQIVAEGPSEDYLNYYNVVTPEEGATFVRSFQKITYLDIYPGIDLEFQAKPGTEKPVEYNFIVHPGADASQIRLKYNGADETRLSEGKITVKVAHGSFYESIPQSNLKETNENIQVKYLITGNNEFGFQFPQYNENQTLIIDPLPILEWGTYYGGSSNDYGNGIVTDIIGNSYVTGTTWSNSSIATSGSYQTSFGGNRDAYIVKFNLSGQRQMATYFGGSNTEDGCGIAIDITGNILMIGITVSSSAIATSGAYQTSFGGGIEDAFIAKFNSTGQRQWSTYFGGGGWDEGNGVITDILGNILITGLTNSTTGISTSGSHQQSLGGQSDAFIAKFNPAGRRQWGTYYGGSQYDEGNGITSDLNSNVIITGVSSSSNSIASLGAYQTVLNGVEDVFIVKFNSLGQRQWGTLYGGAGGEEGRSITTDDNGNIFFTGWTASNNMIATSGSFQPTKGGGFSDAFLVKFNASGQIQWGTYYGGSGYSGNGMEEVGQGIIMVGSGNVIVTGYTESSSNISTSGSHQSAYGGNTDVFIVKFNNSGARLWGTYYGGYGRDIGMGISSYGDYIFITGDTKSFDSIATTGAYQTSQNGGNNINNYDAFIAKFISCYSTYDTISVSVCDRYYFNGKFLYTSGIYSDTLVNYNNCDSIITLQLNILDPNTQYSINDPSQCLLGNFFSLTNYSTIDSGSISYHWYFGDNDSSNLASPSHSYIQPDTFLVKLITVSDIGCRDSLVKTVVVKPMPEADFEISDSIQCIGVNAFSFTNKSSPITGKTVCFWNFGDGDTSTSENPAHSYLSAGTFNVKLTFTSALGCKDSVIKPAYVTADPNLKAAFEINDSSQCTKGNLFDFTNKSTINTGNFTSSWDFGDGDSFTGKDTLLQYSTIDTFLVKLLVVSDYGCKDSVSHAVYTRPMPVGSFTIKDSAQCLAGNLFDFTNNSTLPSGSNTYEWFFGDGQTSTGISPTHQYLSDDTFLVKLIAKSNHNCLDSVSRIAVVYPMPKVLFTINNSSQCLSGNQFSFTNKSEISSGSLMYHWFFGDGDSVQSQHATHSYKTSDSFDVKLIASSAFSCNDSIQRKVYIHPMPIADFSINDSAQCFNDQNFIITNKSTISIGNLTYRWYIDKDSFNTTNLQLSILQPGTLNLKLRTSSDFNCPDSLTKTLIVHPAPLASFSVNDSIQCLAINSFSFVNTSVIQSGSMTYLWRIESANITGLQPINYKFSDWGKFPVRLISTSDMGCTDSTESMLYVYPNPVSAFIYLNNCIEDTMWFFDKSYSDSGSVNQWYWDFKNGQTSSVQNPFRVFYDSGRKAVKLISTNNFGCSHDTTRFFRIEAHVLAPELERATVEQDEFVLIEWSPPIEGKPLTYHLEKSADSMIWNPVSDINYTVNDYNDHQTNVDKGSYFYRLTVTDSCNFTSPYSNIGKTILLTLDSSQEFPVLSWTAYEYWPSGIERYELQIAGYSKWTDPKAKYFMPFESYVQPEIVKDSLSKLNDENYCYRVVAYRQSDQLESVSNEVCVPAISHMFIPNAFTPNNDGLNDVFKPAGMYILEYKLQIFNRWGEQIFESSDINSGWDGRFKGSECPTDNYFYQVSAKGTNGKSLKKAGAVLLLR